MAHPKDMAQVAHSEPTHKKCGKCGHKYSKETWGELPCLGEQRFTGSTEVGEWRNCPCGSSLYVVLVEGDEED